MKTVIGIPATALLVSWILLLYTPLAHAADNSAPGTITGRVLNASNDTYLRNARITLKPSFRETFTDETGHYRFDGVPAGSVSVSVFYTGLATRELSAMVSAGGTTTLDITLERFDSTAADDPLRLDSFVVATNREYNAQSIAINEQRFAAGIKNVVSSDEFGAIGEANIGEFVKFIPGVDVSYNGGIFADFVSVRGFPSSATAVTMDGAQPANAGTGGLQRNFDMNGMQVLNNIARVEVSKTPTPDMPANILGGSVNLVPKSAFERAKPVFSYRISATTNSRYPTGSFPSFMREERISTIRPSGEFGYILPLNKDLGFTLSAAYNERFVVYEPGTSTWDLNRLILTGYNVATSSQRRKSGSWGVTGDWRLAESHVLSGSMNYSVSHVMSPRTAFVAALGANPSGDATFTQSNGFIGSMTNQGNSNADRLDQTWHGGLKYRHTGRTWTIDGNASYSISSSKARYVDKGKFFLATALLPSVSLRYNNIGGGQHPGPESITGATAAGPVDVWDARNFQLRTVTDGRRTVQASTRGLQVNAGRQFDVGFPLKVKTGVYVNRESQDNRTPGLTWTFLGPNGIANDADNIVGLYDFIAEARSAAGMPHGFPRAHVLSAHKIFDYYRANPTQFRLDEAAAIQSRATNSTRIVETISAAYLRADAHLADNRLRLVGGVRFERTQDEGYGLLNDPRNALQQDSNGNLVRDSQGRTIPVTTDPIQRATLVFQERGARAKRSYDGYYPSMNASYNISESVVARVAYARTIGRPNYGNIVPGTIVTDPDVASPTITIRNIALRPWTANAYDISLEKYFANNGVASVGLYRKDIADFFGSIRTPATPELLEELGLTGDYSNYDIVSMQNVGDARISGVEFNYRQALTFLPSWARGLQVFANGTFNKLEGDRDADFVGFARRTINWGISLSRERFVVKLNWNSRGARRGSRLAPSATVPQDTFAWVEARTTLDGSFEIRVSRRLTLVGTARNMTEALANSGRYAASTPDYARNNQYIDPGAFLSLGLKGEF